MTVITALQLATGSFVSADHVRTIWIDPGQKIDIYSAINLSGTVYLAADANGQAACLAIGGLPGLSHKS
jgi:hypothetical protein